MCKNRDEQSGGKPIHGQGINNRHSTKQALPRTRGIKVRIRKNQDERRVLETILNVHSRDLMVKKKQKKEQLNDAKKGNMKITINAKRN